MSFISKITLYSAFILLVLFQGCQKTEKEYAPVSIDSSWQEHVKSQDGTLVFAHWDDAYAAIKYLNENVYADVEAFGKKYNFYSQHQLFHEVVDAEEKVIESSFKDLTDVKTMDEAISKGYTQPTHSLIYQEAVNAGILKSETDKIDEQFYFYTVSDPTVVSIIDKEGFMAIGDTLWQYTDSFKKVIFHGGVNSKDILRKAVQTNENEGIMVFEQRNDLGQVQERDQDHAWNFCPSYANTCSANAWKTNGPRRARATRTGNSHLVAGACSYTMNCQFYTSVYAQRKIVLVWAFSNTYTPTFTYNGSWHSEYKVTNDHSCCLPYCSTILSAATPGLGITTSPMVNRTYSGNNVASAVALHPHTSGYWTAGGWWQFTDGWNVTYTEITTTCTEVGNVD